MRVSPLGFAPFADEITPQLSPGPGDWRVDALCSAKVR